MDLTCLIFTNLDRVDDTSDMIPTIAKMRASKHHLLDDACFYNWNLAAKYKPWKRRKSPIFFVILCFSLWTRARRTSWQSPLFVFLLKSRLILCVSVRSRFAVKSFLQSTSVWSRGLVEYSSVCIQRIIRLNIVWSPCLWSPVVLWHYFDSIFIFQHFYTSA